MFNVRDLRDLLFSRVSGQEAADLGYVNPGTDKRLGGEIGRLLGKIQSDLSFKSPDPPHRKMYAPGLDSALVAVDYSVPWNRPHISIAVPRSNGRWATIRVGWRYDANWGDHNVIGYNPEPEIVGGYIFDVVIKLNAERSFIDV